MMMVVALMMVIVVHMLWYGREENNEQVPQFVPKTSGLTMINTFPSSLPFLAPQDAVKAFYSLIFVTVVMRSLWFALPPFILGTAYRPMTVWAFSHNKVRRAY